MQYPRRAKISEQYNITLCSFPLDQDSPPIPSGSQTYVGTMYKNFTTISIVPIKCTEHHSIRRDIESKWNNHYKLRNDFLKNILLIFNNLYIIPFHLTVYHTLFILFQIRHTSCFTHQYLHNHRNVAKLQTLLLLSLFFKIIFIFICV
jgi:hypothetical protein